MPGFEKPLRRRPREEPSELEQFAARAAVTPVIVREIAAPEPPSPSPEGPPKRPKRGGDGLSMNVRFSAEEKRALELLAEREERSQQAILMRIAGPLLLEAARRLDAER